MKNAIFVSKADQPPPPAAAAQGLNLMTTTSSPGKLEPILFQDNFIPNNSTNFNPHHAADSDSNSLDLLSQLQAIKVLVNEASNYATHPQTMSPQFHNEYSSSSSSPSSSSCSTCSTAAAAAAQQQPPSALAFCWRDFLLEDALLPADQDQQQDHQMLVEYSSKETPPQSHCHNETNHRNTGLPSYGFHASSSATDTSFVAAMLDQENQIGNLHRAPDIPRRWLMPTPKISLKDFKSLLHRRNKALSRLRSSSSSSDPDPDPDPNPNPNPDSKPRLQSPKQNAPPIEPKLEAPVDSELPQDCKSGAPPTVTQVDVVEGSKAEDCLLKLEDEQADKDEIMQVDEKPPEETEANVEVIENVSELNEKEKRKRDVEDKLQILNAKKHNLVQVLKQLLNAEEELKRRNSIQGTGVRPAGQLQVETTNDSVSMTRIVTPRIGSEANLAGENEGVEADDVSNPNIHSRHVFRMSSTSPSSESPLRRPTYLQHNVPLDFDLINMSSFEVALPVSAINGFSSTRVPHPSRATMGVTGSPSRFAPIGNQGHPGNPPTVSVSGTNYVASSPSPAASGGTSVFREARQPSPWN
ncbi:hypothetical protein COLO4_21256 [Corchorus olitorius]|uniref:Uncharacterized protein n=1 Tax=Corchorus olitorius TaxID=93759 RepID=A0A1R3IUJ7_9ROSI|nr:hypothetical protein COLO4_21256 [Corchorus olitorius]